MMPTTLTTTAALTIQRVGDVCMAEIPASHRTAASLEQFDRTPLIAR